MPSLDKDATDKFEVNKPLNSSRYRLRPASLIPAGTGHIPHARAQKTIKQTKPHPLNGWANPRLKELKEHNCSNMDRLLNDSVNESYRVLVGEKLYNLFDGVSTGKFSWRPDKKLKRRLNRSGEEFDEAAHDQYLSLMNDCAPCLVTESMQMLLDLAKDATSNNPGE